MSDPRWRLNNVYLIVNKNSERVKFQENRVQKMLNDSVSKRRMILKTRQMGVTTGEVLKQLDAVMFNRNMTACILAHEDDAIAKIFNTPRNAYRWMPEAFKPEIDRGGGSKYEMFFPKMNSRIYCDLESRGDTIHWLHVSEAAFMDKERLDATLQAVPIDGIVTIETTANGLENFFYETWSDNKEIYEKFFLPWFFYEEYQIPIEKLKATKEEKEFSKKTLSLYKHHITHAQMNFRRRKIEEIKAKFNQEYPEDDLTCFIHSGRTVVDQVLFRQLLDEVSPVVETREDVLIFHPREPHHDYVVGADVAEGVGGDFSVASVFCVQTMEEVAFFRDQISPFLFAKKLTFMCGIFSMGYRVPLLAVESNNHGHAVLLELEENIGYANLFYSAKDRVGWKTDSITRPIMLDQLIEAVSSRHVRINSRETLKEMMLLVEDRKKIQAPSGKHDDSAVSAAIGVQMLLANSAKVGIYKNIERDIMV